MKKSKFNLTHPASFTANMGKLVPFYLQECLPGDVFRMRAKSFIRAQPMLAPMMHQVNFFVQYWFVPNRIIWNEWESFITGGNDGLSTPVFPTIKVNPAVSSLADYFGVPVNNKELEVNALPFRAYTEIYNTRYRDQDLQQEKPISYDSGLDTTTKTDLLNCAWAKDRFTMARPFTQRGAQISVPVVPGALSGKAYPVYSPVIKIGEQVETAPSTQKLGSIILGASGSVSYSLEKNIDTSVTSGYFEVVNYKVRNKGSLNSSVSNLPACSLHNFKTKYINVTITWGNIISYSDSPVAELSSDIVCDSGTCYDGKESYGPNVNMNLYFSANYTVLKSITQINILRYTLPTQIDMSQTGSVNIRDLRLAGATQRYQENSLEWGNRYEEFIQREFKVRPKDARIQRPEYIGGAKTMLQISEVLQTSEGTETGVGTMRGHGVGGLSTMRIRFHCPEHGFIIGIMSIRPHAVYSQGLDKFWRKFTKFDYFTPEFAHIGMQEIMQSELYANGTNYDTVFGYEPRYDEYRKSPSRIAGEFRGGQVLDFWNLSRNFNAPPVLNGSFIEMNPSSRIFAEQTQNQFLIMLRNEVIAYRSVPKRAKNLLM